MNYIELVEKYKNYSVKELKNVLFAINEHIKDAKKEMYLNEGLYTEDEKKIQYNTHEELLNEFYYVRDLMFEKEENNE